jgi:hypothetical protein
VVDSAWAREESSERPNGAAIEVAVVPVLDEQALQQLCDHINERVAQALAGSVAAALDNLDDQVRQAELRRETGY